MDGNYQPQAIGAKDSLVSMAPRVLTFLVIASVILYILSYFYLKDEIHLKIHDNLDGEFLYLHLLAKTGQAFNFRPDAVIENVMNGLPRSLLRSGLNVTVLLFVLFDSLTAYIMNDLIVHAIGFIGMYLLLTRYIIRGTKQRYIAVFLSLSFTLIPFYSAANGISVAGQPLLLFSFLNILNMRHRISDYLVIILFPFYSWIVLVGPFIVIALLIVSLFDAVKNKSINYKFLLWIFILCMLYVAIEFQMFYAVLFNSNITIHRVEWRGVDFRLVTFFSCLRDTLDHLLTTQRHSGTFYTFPIILSTLAALFTMRYSPHARAQAQRNIKIPPRPPLAKGGWGDFYITLKGNHVFSGVLVSILAITFFWGFYPFFIYFPAKFIPKIQVFQWDRFYFLLPLCWFILFAFSLLIIIQSRNRYVVWFVYLALLAQLFAVIAGNTRFLMNVHAVVYKTISKYTDISNVSWFPKNKSPNFRQFFAVNLFSQIRDYINKDQSTYRVVSIGMHPSVAQYNGFYTLDSYQSSYPLEYKHRFRAIIAPELDKSVQLKEHFYGWGSRCYVFSSELYDGCYSMCGKDNSVKITDFNINTAALKKMGGAYILSAVEITNYDKLNLSYEKSFDDKDSFWKIYLYKVL